MVLINLVNNFVLGKRNAVKSSHCNKQVITFSERITMEKKNLEKFVKEERLEWHWNNDETQMFLILYYHSLKDFIEMLGVDYLTECQPKVTLSTCGDVVVEMVELCSDFDIEPREIFNKPSWDSDKTLQYKTSFND